MDEVEEHRQRLLGWYVALLVVPAAGCLVIAAPRVGLYRWSTTVFLLAVSVGLGWFSANMRSFDGHVTLASVVVLAAYPLVGPWAAVIVSAAPLLDFANDFTRQQRVFNAAVSVLPTMVGVGVWTLLHGPDLSAPHLSAVHHIPQPTHFPAAVLACLVTDLVRFVVNALLFVPLTVLLTGQRPGRVLHQIRRDLWRSALPAHLGYGPLGVLLAVLWAAGLGPLAALLVLAPLVSAHIAFDRSAQEEDARTETLRTLIQAVETKDPYTRGHSERVARGVELLGTATGVSGTRLAILRFAGLLHDVGKLGVPTRVLTKTGGLTATEFGEIRAHPAQGFEIITGIDFLDGARQAILHHHERLDGAGYPTGLAGDAIPEFARIISVVDAFDSMTSSRSYHRARSVSEALAELQRCAGSHFDPAFVDAFCAAVVGHGWRVTATGDGTAVSVGGVAADPERGDTEVVVPAAGGPPAEPYDHDDPTVVPPVVPTASR